MQDIISRAKSFWLLWQSFGALENKIYKARWWLYVWNIWLARNSGCFQNLNIITQIPWEAYSLISNLGQIANWQRASLAA